MNSANRVAKNTAILYVRMGITMFISLYSMRLILAALGAADFGIFNVVGGAITMLTFLNAAMTTATQRFMSYAQGEKNYQKQIRIFNVSIVLHFFIGLTVVLLLEIFGYFLFSGILKIDPARIYVAKLIYQFLIVSTFFTIIAVPYDAVVNAHENMLFVAVLGILGSVFKLSIAFYITATGLDKLASYGFLMAAMAVLLLIIMAIYCHRNYEEVQVAVRRYWDNKLFKDMAVFASWSLVISSARIITMQGSSILLNSFFGVLVNAAQGVANQIAGQLMAFSNMMLKALNPVIVKSEGAKNRANMLEAAIYGNKLSYFLFTFFAIPVFLEMPCILNLWLKDVPEFAILFCRLILLRVSFSQLTVTFPTVISATGKIKNFMVWKSIIWSLLLPASYIVFYLGAPPSAIYINLIILFMGLLCLNVYFVYKLCKLDVKKYFKDVVLRCVFNTSLVLLISAIPLFTMELSLLRLLLVITTSVIGFFTFGLGIGFTKKEKQQVFSTLKTITYKLSMKKMHSS